MEKEVLLTLLSQSDENDKESLLKLLSKLIPKDSEISNQQKKEILINALNSYDNPNYFKVGQLVRWKKGLKNKKRPSYDEPAIVVEILETPFVDSDANIASPYFQESLDFKLGIVSNEGDFYMFYYDKQRFEPFVEIGEEQDSNKALDTL